MQTRKLAVGAAASAVLFLAACEPEPFNPNDPNANARTAAIGGAVIGGLLGRGDTDDVVRGAAIGAAAGALIGNAMDNQARELANSLDSDIGVIRSGDDIIVRMPQDILFAIDSAAVNSALRDDLLVLADSLNRYPDTVVSIVGHTDNTGDAGYNLDLSDRRALAVAGILRQGGVSPSRLRAFGAGEDEPIASNLNAAGRALNRRVEITISPL